MLKKAWAVAFFSVVLVLTKRIMNGNICKSTDRIDGKVVIVTGANGGIGKETVEELLKRGGKVYMACRSLELANEAARDIKKRVPVGEDRLIVMHLDLGSLKSVRAFVEKFKQAEKHLDILINNAGVMFVPESQTEDGFELTFGVNHLGHFLLTHLLMDLMVDSGRPSRIINLSSLAHQTSFRTRTMDFDDLMFEAGYNSVNAYSQSKLANILFTRELARRLEGTNVTTYSVHPGVIITEIDRHILTPFKQYKFGRFLNHVMKWPFLKDPWYGIQTTICCAVDTNLSAHTGKYYSDCDETTPSDEALNDDDALRLWDVSIDLVKLQPGEIHSKLRS